MYRKPSYIKNIAKEDPISINQNKKIQPISLSDSETESELDEWAKFLRRNYITDKKLNAHLRTISSKKEKKSDLIASVNKYYLPENKKGINGGNIIRIGDFGEILIEDYLQFIEDYCVPRTKHRNKSSKNKSTFGSDVIGYKICNKQSLNNDDELIVIEVKTTCTTNKSNVLQKAVNDSCLDIERVAETINKSYDQLLDQGREDEANTVSKFLSVDPFKIKYGAAAVCDDKSYSKTKKSNYFKELDTSKHRGKNLLLLVVHRKRLSELISKLYERAMKC